MYQLSELFWYKPLFAAELLIAMHLFSMHQPRRKYFPLRLILTILGCLGLSFSIPVLVYEAFYVSFMFLVLFAFCSASLILVYRIPFKNLFLIAITSYTAQHLSHEVYGFCVTAAGMVTSSTLGFYGNAVLDLSHLTQMDFFKGLIYINIYLVVYAAVYFILAKKIPSSEVKMDTISVFIISGIILLVDIILNALVVYIQDGYSKMYSLITSFNNILACLMVLYIQFSVVNIKALKTELTTTSQLLHQSQEQYKNSKENMELINLKCHDLKHQIREVGSQGNIDQSALKNIENIISIYDSNVETGNAALNLILTEKSLLCTQKGIKLTCLADCSKLSFIANPDLYSLFGNIIDNAIEAVLKIDDKEQRNISLIVKNVNSFVSINEVNYYKGDIHLDYQGLPETTKSDKNYHGFGMKSIKMIVDQYHGDLTISSHDQLFSLSILFPVPVQAPETK
jgi:signal transduction histidine kinase